MLASAVAAVAQAAPDDADDWWIIGSTAMVLCGVEGVEPDDVDILGSGRTLERFLGRWGVEADESRHGAQFRSHPYQRVILDGCTPIEVMGDLLVLSDGAWLPVVPASRLPVGDAGAKVYVPTLEDQSEILKRFGRPKDLAKAAMIARFLAG